jgi:hypothetical protein
MPQGSADEKEGILHAGELARLYAYWNAVRGQRRMPAREDIDPVALRDILPHIVMVDVEREPLRFRYRLVGTYVNSISGRDITGLYADAATFPNRLEEVVTPYRLVVEHRAPVGKYGQARWVPNRPWVRLETLLLPLGRTDDDVEIILIGIAQYGRGGTADRGDADATMAVEGVHVFLNPAFAEQGP